MASWISDDRFTANRNDWEWDSDLSSQEVRNPFRSSNPILLSEFNLWEKSLFKSRSSALSCVRVSQSDHSSKISTSSIGGQCGMKHSETAARQRWQSASRRAPDGAPRSHSEFEIRNALEESSMRRTELIQRLREVHSRLDTQTDLLKAKESQLQHSQSTTQLLELKHKLAKALSVVEEQKEAAELSRFEESCRSTDLQDKVLQLEMDILKMKCSLESTAQISASHSKPHLGKTMPVTKDEFVREKKAEREMKKLEEALGEAEERAASIGAEKDHALKQLRNHKEDQQTVLSQMEELKQRFSMSLAIQSELQDQLSETRSRLGQLELENELLTTKTLRLEDNIEDLKSKLSNALAEKDRLVQEKAELYQRVQSLELELQRSQLGREGFTQQVCDLHSELTQTKSQASQQQQSALLMKEELQSVREANEKLSADLATATERLQETLQHLHELEAEKLIQTNQIAALETERLQLIGEKEELMDVFDQGDQKELRDLRERCCQLRELQEMLEYEKKELEAHCQGLEKKVQNVEAEYGLKEQELKLMEEKMEQEKEELKRVAAHWNERWLDVAMELQATQAQLEETKKQQQETDAPREEAAEMAIKLETLESEMKDRQNLIQRLLEEKTHYEKELTRVKKEAGALERVELDACRQQLELERNRSQTLQQRLMGNPVSLEEMDGELVQLKAELQKVWEMLKNRDTELEEQQHELQSARGKVTQQNSEVQRLEQQLAKRDQELKQRDLFLTDLMTQRDTEKTEAQIKITALEDELAGLKDLKTIQKMSTQHDSQPIDSLLEESNRTTEQLKQEKEQDLLKVHSVKPPQQGKGERRSPLMKRKETAVRSDIIDPDQQRRLITEQLKSLFKGREQMGDMAPPMIQRRTGSVLDCGSKSPKVIKNTVDTVRSEVKRQQKCGLDSGVHEKTGEPTVEQVAPEKEPQHLNCSTNQ
ncbi:golgin subfamily A member 4 isoform X2 [Ictalurus furcatus]|uniref:golgin subfamily A member 4 isoform X2 n=1 Tax=Ictalurus furcatus TaxID=66913 RepID=UPI0023508C8A|nr:golgin subfamily A member 4 isoform X2 [Ictalurus furcatus]